MSSYAVAKAHSEALIELARKDIISMQTMYEAIFKIAWAEHFPPQRHLFFRFPLSQYATIEGLAVPPKIKFRRIK